MDFVAMRDDSWWIMLGLESVGVRDRAGRLAATKNSRFALLNL